SGKAGRLSLAAGEPGGGTLGRGFSPAATAAASGRMPCAKTLRPCLRLRRFLALPALCGASFLACPSPDREPAKPRCLRLAGEPFEPPRDGRKLLDTPASDALAPVSGSSTLLSFLRRASRNRTLPAH